MCLSQLSILCTPLGLPGAQCSAAQGRSYINIPQTSWNLPESPGVPPPPCHRPTSTPDTLPFSRGEQMADSIPSGILSAAPENSVSVILGKERKRGKK